MARSLEREEEYRVRDTERELVTEAGRALYGFEPSAGMLRHVLAIEAEAALLARRAPGDAGLREAIDAELALLGDEPRNQFESGAAAAYHWVLAHLADSRPEEPPE